MSAALLPTFAIAFFSSSGETPEFLRPIPKLVILVDIYSGAILAARFALIVSHISSGVRDNLEVNRTLRIPVQP